MTANARVIFWIAASLPVFAGCATRSDVGQVKEVAPGTYRIGVARGGSLLIGGGTEAANAAVEQAGQYCHSKGQKLVVLYTPDKDITFRCGGTPGE
jgi:hypothetical protein